MTKFNTKSFLVGILVLLLMLLIFLLLWKYIQDEVAPETNFLCGQQLALEAYENSGPEQEVAVYTQWLASPPNNTDAGKIERVELMSELSCFRHSELPSQGYFLHQPKGQNYLLQAVHARDDLHTGEIVLALMQQTDSAKYANISSVGRQLLDASTQQTLSNQLAVKLIEGSEAQMVIQVHGFAKAKRKTRAARLADVIISSGDKDANYQTTAIYQCLQENFDNVYLFGKNVYELGATENFLSHNLQDHAYSENFVHIELSLQQRKELLKPSELKRFSECLALGTLNATIN